METLQQSRIRPFGAGDDLAEAAEPAVLSAPDGTTYAFLGFNAIGETPRATADEPGRAVGPDAAAHRAARRGRRRPRRARGRAGPGASPTWWSCFRTGASSTRTPRGRTSATVARRLVAAGADLVVGGHPHWVQGVDAVDGVPVLHSLGNFVFDMDRIPDPEVAS